MDCGPASLASLLSLLGVSVSYGRLRDLCATDVDGTSIDTIQKVSADLGMTLEQVLIPPEFLFARTVRSLPCLIVVLKPNGFTHFVVASQASRKLVEVMDPAVGRRLLSRSEFVRWLYSHEALVPMDQWLDWATSASFKAVLFEFAQDHSIDMHKFSEVFDEAVESRDWRRISTLDACLRSCATLGDASNKVRSTIPKEFLALYEAALADPEVLPQRNFQVAPDGDDESQARVKGAVLLRVPAANWNSDGTAKREEAVVDLRESASLDEPEYKGKQWLPVRLLIAALPKRTMGVLWFTAILTGLLTVAEISVLAIVLRLLPTPSSAFIYLIVPLLLAPILVYALVDYLASRLTFELGRGLDTRLSGVFLRKLLRLPDRYFSSRTVSDLLDRAHKTYIMRSLPNLVLHGLANHARALAIVVMLIFLEPGLAVYFLALGLAYALLPFLVLRSLQEKNYQALTHNGALSTQYLDLLRGKDAVDAHDASSSIELEQESLLLKWRNAELSFLNGGVLADGIQWTIMLALICAVVVLLEGRGNTFLVAFWLLQLPVLSSVSLAMYRQYQRQHNVALRLHELLASPEDEVESTSQAGFVDPVEVEFRSVSVSRSSQKVLSDVNLKIEKGEHLAIVGESGSGKSTFVSTLLGWLPIEDGDLTVDGRALAPSVANELRHATAWIDPDSYLWNDTIVRNILGFSGDQTDPDLEQVLTISDVMDDLPRRKLGLETSVGENASKLSGGEGQRLRIARAMVRQSPVLVILDEALRGLDSKKRRALLDELRKYWADATLINVTHDPEEALDFDRVLVFSDGCLVEEGNPASLSANAQSEFARLVESKHVFTDSVLAPDKWTQAELEQGSIS